LKLNGVTIKDKNPKKDGFVQPSEMDEKMKKNLDTFE